MFWGMLFLLTAMLAQYGRYELCMDYKEGIKKFNRFHIKLMNSVSVICIIIAIICMITDIR